MPSSFTLFALFFCATCIVAKQSEITELTDSNFKKVVLDSEEVWLIAFISPTCPHCRNLMPTWEKVAQKLISVGVRVGRVNGGVTGSKKKPVDYNGPREGKKLVSFAASKIPKVAKTIDSISQISENHDRYLVLLSEKRKVPYLFNGVCSTFSNQIQCGFVSQETQPDLTESLQNGASLPILIYGEKDKDMVYYPSEKKFHFDDIADWLDSLIDPESPSKGNQNTKESSSSSSKKKNTFEDEKSVIPIEKLEEITQKCLNSKFCLIPIVVGELTESLSLLIEQSAAYWKSPEKITVAYSLADSEYLTTLERLVGNGPKISEFDSTRIAGWFLIRPHKKRVAFVDGSQDLVEIISNGSPKWKKVDGSMDIF